MQARDKTGIRAGVWLNVEQFELITQELGARSDTSRARLLGVDPKTIYRARRGVIGEEFIAKALAVMLENAADLEAIGIKPSFEAMFEVGTKEVAA